MKIEFFNKLSANIKLSQLKKNVLSGSVLASGNIILLLISYPIYLKFLGAEQYGLWATLSVVIFFSHLGNLGINNALIKYVAGEFGKGNYKGITRYTTTSFSILIFPSIIILLVLFLFNSKIVTFLGLKSSYVSIAENLIPLIGLLSVFVLFAELVKGVLIGIGRLDLSNYVFLFGRIIQFVISVILIISGIGIWALYFGMVCSYIIITIIYLYILCIRYKIEIFKIRSFTKSCVKELLVFGGTLFSARVVSMLVQPFNKVIISKYIGLSEVSYYEIAMKGALNLRSLFEMGLKAIMPKVSELQQRLKDIKNIIINIHKKCIKFILFFALPVYFGLFVLAEFVLSIWLGNRYNPQITMALKWFLFGYIINLFSVPSYYIFIGLNKVNLCFYASSIKSFANCMVILSLIFVGFPLNFNLIIAVNTFAMIGSALFLVIIYYLKIGQYVIRNT